jgi:hypothetical protein
MAACARKYATSKEANATLHVVRAIRERGLDWVLTKHKLNASRHSEHPHLVQLHYDQLKSSLRSPVVRECRGIILDEVGPGRRALRQLGLAGVI